MELNVIETIQFCMGDPSPPHGYLVMHVCLYLESAADGTRSEVRIYRKTC